jgi:transcriptional regulator with XRE-family HTH domain
MLIGKVLKYIRLFHHYNQVELSQKLNASRSYISEIESGVKIPSIEFLQKYSDYFDIPISTIMLFAETGDTSSLQGKSKIVLTNTAVKLLEWIAREEDEKE